MSRTTSSSLNTAVTGPEVYPYTVFTSAVVNLLAPSLISTALPSKPSNSFVTPLVLSAVLSVPNSAIVPITEDPEDKVTTPV